MLDVSSTDQQDLLSPNNGTPARSVEPSAGEAFAASWEAAQRLDGYDAEYQNQRDFAQQRFDGFTAKTGVAIPPQTSTADPGIPTIDTSYQDWLTGARAIMQREAASRNDPTLLPPSDEDIATGGLALARGAVRRQAQLSQGPITLGSIAGSTAAGAASSTIDPLNALSLALAPEGGPLLATALRMGGAMAGQQLLGDVARFGYRQQVDPSYGVGDVAKDVLEAGAGGALFGAGHVLGGEGVRGALGAAAGGALGGGVLGAIGGGLPGAIEGAAGGAALPLAGAGLGLSARSLGMSWRAFKARSPDAAASMPLEVRDAGEVAEKAGDLMAQSTFRGASGEAAHAEAIDATEKALFVGQPVELPASAEAEAAARRGTVFFPGGSIDARYDVAEHSDLIASHDADFRVNPAYPPELQPRDRSGAPAQDQVNSIAANLEPDRLGPSPEANSGAPIVGPDGIVESGNGRTLAIGRAYDLGRAGPYRAWLERQGFDTTGMDRPVLVGMRETPLDAGQRADFAHAANGSASLRMSATEQAMSDARLIDGSTLDLAKSPDLTAAANRDLARAFVAKLPEGERGGLLKLDGGMSANGAQRMRAALTARAYGDPAFLSRTFDHLDGNIKAIGGAMADAAPAWARMRDATTRGDIAPGHDITRDLLQAVHAVMRARDEGRPPWEVLNQGDMFQSDTTQLAARMFFRDEEMRQPAGRKAIADALTSYAEEAAKNTLHGRLFDDAVPPADVLRRMGAAAVEKIESLFDTAVRDVSAVGRPGRLASNPMEATAFRARWDGLDRDAVLPMFGGERAAGADLGALERAKQLEAQKVGPAKIHAETGWFKRADGWRFEIDDSKVKFKDDAFRSPDDEDDDGGDFSFGGDGLFGRRGEMSGGGAATTYSGRLGDLVDAPDLFHAYPQLAGVDIRIGRSGSTSLGSFDPAKGRIEVDGSADKPQILSTLLHEIQHAVQLEEGFSAGGNSETLARRTQAALSMSRDRSRGNDRAVTSEPT